MSFDVVKNKIVSLMQSLGYAESSEATNFEGAPASEHSNTFILTSEAGEQPLETLVDRFYDMQEWRVQVAFSKSQHSEKIELDQLHRAKDSILTTLDNPANWTGGARVLKYNSWDVEELDSYYVLIVNLRILDTYTY